MGVSGGGAIDRAQAESGARIIGGAAQPAVIEGQRLGAPALEKQFPVLAPGDSAAEDFQCTGSVKIGLERSKNCVNWAHVADPGAR